MHLLNLTALRHGDTAVNNINDLLNPWPVATKMVQDVPVSIRRPRALTISSTVFVISLRMPPTLPAGVVRLTTGTLVLQVPRVQLSARTWTCRGVLCSEAPVESQNSSGYAGEQQRSSVGRRHLMLCDGESGCFRQRTGREGGVPYAYQLPHSRRRSSDLANAIAQTLNVSLVF